MVFIYIFFYVFLSFVILIPPLFPGFFTCVLLIPFPRKGERGGIGNIDPYVSLTETGLHGGILQRGGGALYGRIVLPGWEP